MNCLWFLLLLLGGFELFDSFGVIFWFKPFHRFHSIIFLYSVVSCLQRNKNNILLLRILVSNKFNDLAAT